MLHQNSVPFLTDPQRRLRRLLADLCLDDCLTADEWRVEYLQLDTQKPHFRVFRAGQLIGIADVRTPRKLPFIYQRLASWLIKQGFRVSEAHIQQYGALTNGKLLKTGIPRLVDYPTVRSR